MTSLKGSFLKIFLLLLIFSGVVAAYFVLTYEDPINIEEDFETATLPVISMNFNNKEINTLHGYRQEMEGQYMRDVITPMTSEKKLNITINKYENVIAGISYEVRSVDTTRLIESISLDSWTIKDNTVTAQLDLTTILESNTEYLLIIKLTTEQHGLINYYSRIIEETNSNISQNIDFIKSFSNATKDADKFHDYISNLEIDSSKDNSNLAIVDISSSFDNLTWGNMKVENISAPIISITDITDDTGSFILTYKVRSKNSYDTYQYYDVTEFFRVKATNSVNYLYVYERKAEQAFDPNTQNVSTTRINLGLDSDLNVHYKYSDSASFISFVKDGSLWTMDMKKNKIISLFSFDNLEHSDVRTEYNNYDIEIVSTDDSGDTLFIVYGYMETGYHEGNVGVSLYKYTYETNSLDEIVYIPSTKPFSILKESVGKFAYMTDDDILYFMIGNGIYTVAMNSNEYVQIVSDLTPNNHSINYNNTILAWNENTDSFSNSKIRVMDVATKKTYTIDAPEGEYVRILGFIDNDLIYGFTKIDDVNSNNYPMYKLGIIVYNTSETEFYQKENVYVSSVKINNNIMTLIRQKKNSDGSFVSIEDDKLVNKSGSLIDEVSLSTIVTDLKKTELVLNFAYTVTSNEDFISITPETISFKSPNSLDLNENPITAGKYYAYTKGIMTASYSSLKKAIEYAYPEFGVVIDENGNKLWGRISKPTLAKLSNTSTLVEKNFKTKDDILNSTDYNAYNITGTDIENIFYYAPNDIPVITYTKETGLAILSAYSTYFGKVDVIAFTRLSDGEIIKMDYSDAIASLKESGNIFIVLTTKN